MEKCATITVLREMLHEQICCMGRIVARHQVPDDVVWEISKGFTVIYERARRRIEASAGGPVVLPVPHRMEPHPGLAFLLEKLDQEASTQDGETVKK